MNAEEYRRKAQHFLDMARLISSPEDKAAMMELATFWEQLAKQAEPEQQGNSGAAKAEKAAS